MSKKVKKNNEKNIEIKPKPFRYFSGSISLPNFGDNFHYLDILEYYHFYFNLLFECFKIL